jgi:hypothetical protein
VQVGTQLVNAAGAQGLTLRMNGGVAIYARCPSIEGNARLQRPYGDIDFVVDAGGWQRIGDVFTANGFSRRGESANEQHFVKDGVLAKVSTPTLHEDFDLDVSSRLALVPLTLPLVDLLLIKLARVDFKEKEIQDAAALLVDHRVADDGDEEEDINRTYLYHLVNNEYKLWKTVFDNTVTLEKVYDKYLEPEQAQLAWRRTELLQEVLDGKGHSFGWWAGRVLSP